MKVVNIPAPASFNGAELKFAEFLKAAMDQYEPMGKGAAQIRQACKIYDKIDALNGDASMQLEDADFEVVKAAVESAKWKPSAARAILPFIDAMEKALKA